MKYLCFFFTIFIVVPGFYFGTEIYNTLLFILFIHLYIFPSHPSPEYMVSYLKDSLASIPVPI